MMEQCAILVDSNLSMGYAGSVQNAPTMTCVLCVTMAINITYGTASSVLTHRAVAGTSGCMRELLGNGYQEKGSSKFIHCII